MLASYYVATQKNLSWGTQQQKFCIKITDSCLCYEHGEKKLNGNSGILWKMDIVKMTHFTHY